MTSSSVLQQAQSVEAAAFGLAEAVRDPGSVASDEVLALFEVVDRIGRAVGTARLLLARRVDETGEAQRRGKASGAELLAELSGTSVGAAKSDLDASRNLDGLDDTLDAMLRGDVSPEQGKVIAGAAKVNPSAQDRLLRTARTDSHKGLREEAQRVRAEADDDAEATHRRHHRARRLSTWVDDEGAWNLRARGTLADGAVIQKAIERETDRIFRERASATHHEPREAYAFDALHHLATREEATSAGPRRQPAPQHLALLRLDVAALRRGSVLEGERCEIAGLGPISVATAKHLLGDAVLKLLITDGVDVLNVTSLTRGPTQAMRYASLWTTPMCAVDGCDRTICEFDHVITAEYAKTGHTRLDEIDHICTHHHDLHTRFGWALVIDEGRRLMVPPEHPCHPLGGREARAGPSAAV